MGERDFVFRGKGSVLQDEKLLGVRCTAVQLGDATDCMLTNGQDDKLHAMCSYHGVCLCVCVRLFVKVGSQEAGTWRCR